MNLIGASEEADEEAHLVSAGRQNHHHEFRRHNSNLNQPKSTLEIQDQQEILRDLDDS